MPDRICTRCTSIIPAGATRCGNCAATPRLTGYQRQRRNRAVLERDGHVCQVRLRCTGALADCVDHIVPLAEGGSNAMTNLQAACQACNQAKGAQVL